MIYYAPPGIVAAAPVASIVAEHAATSGVYQTTAAANPPVEFSLEGPEGALAKMQPEVRDVMDEFDWSKPRTQREFVHLEQKVLAGRANVEERQRYESMKRDRNGEIFAERYVSDYAEVQRLRKLSETLVILQQYLRPIEL